jgi:hypothetical protein
MMSIRSVRSLRSIYCGLLFIVAVGAIFVVFNGHAGERRDDLQTETPRSKSSAPDTESRTASDPFDFKLSDVSVVLNDSPPAEQLPDMLSTQGAAAMPLADDLTDEALLAKIRDVQQIERRVTAKPHRMNPNTAGLCIVVPKADVHGDRFCDVFVSTEAEKTIRSGLGKYPANSLIVKAKYPRANRKNIELYTVMRKMDAGYAPESGDWEYAVVDGAARHVLARGLISSCVECHQEYKSTDFVTRTYLSDAKVETLTP